MAHLTFALVLIHILLFGLVVSQGGLWSQGQNLEVVVIESPPFVYRQNGTGEHGEKAEGYLIDVWDAISKRLHFDYRIHFVRDGKYGRMLPDGRWIGIVGELINRQAQVGLAALTINSQREAAIDFTYPFMTTGITAMMKKPNKSRKEVKFTDFHGLAALDNVSYGTLQAGSTNQFFVDSKHDLFKAMGKIMNLKQHELPTTIKEAVDQVKKSNNFVFLGESTMLDYHVGRECDLMKLDEEINSVGYGIGFPRGHHLTSTISLALLEMQDKGVLSRLKQKWWVRKCPKLKLCACQLGVSSEENTGEDLMAEGASHKPNSVGPVVIGGIGLVIFVEMLTFGY